MVPGPVMSAGMMPALDLPGLITPGQFGPMIRVLLPVAPAWAQKFAVSCTGMPSVITTHSPMPASMASTTAPFANFGGTNTTVTSASVSAMASPTELNTGSDAPPLTSEKSAFWPPLPGVTPPTTLLPDASMRRVCLVPSAPVMPWTMILLSSLRKIAMSGSGPLRGKLGGRAGRVVHGVDLLEAGQRGLGEDAAALVGVVAVQAHHDRLVDGVAARRQQLERLHDAVGHGVARGDATEDVDEHRPHVAVTEDDLQAVRHDLGRRAAADVEEVGRPDIVLRPGVGDDVQRRHDEAGAVADDADLAVQLDVVEVLGLRLGLERVLGGGVDEV